LQLKVIKLLAPEYVEYSDEPPWKIVKQLDLDAFSGKQSIASVEQEIKIFNLLTEKTNMEETY
jgi:hypothetical protein